jgi:hypothetical protein
MIWRVGWRRYLWWMPFQPCIGCPRWHWRVFRGYCSRVCHDNSESW